MYRAIHFVASEVPDVSCLPWSGDSGRAVSFSPFSSRSNYKTLSQVNIVSLKCTTRGMSSVCKAGPSGYRRNPKFSRQNEHGFSRSRNGQNEERDCTKNLEESDLLPSKKGPVDSSPCSPKFQATTTPGPREKRIVELFKKVRVQLRERAAIKEEKKTEELQGHGKESETVDSLLKLLKKHTIQQQKKGSGGSNSSSRDFNLNQPEEISTVENERSTSFFNLNNHVKDGVEVRASPTSPRPLSNFQRKSPVPQVNIHHSSVSNTSLDGKRERIDSHPEMEHQMKLEIEHEAVFSDGDVFHGMSEDDGTSDVEEGFSDGDAEEQNPSPDRDLSSLKLTELRALAKSRGMKGFSKLKKQELVKMLTSGCD